MCITERQILEVIEPKLKELRDELEDSMVKSHTEIKKEVHQTSPETHQRIQALHDHIREAREEAREDSADVKRRLEAHTSKEAEFWEKIDTLVETVNHNKVLLEENIDGIKGVTNLINASKMLKGFVTYVVVPLGAVIATIYAIKEWIIKA